MPASMRVILPNFAVSWAVSCHGRNTAAAQKPQGWAAAPLGGFRSGFRLAVRVRIDVPVDASIGGGGDCGRLYARLRTARHILARADYISLQLSLRSRDRWRRIRLPFGGLAVGVNCTGGHDGIDLGSCQRGGGERG